MREVITDDDLLELAETCRYEDYAAFVAEHREYARRMGFGMPAETDDQRERASAVRSQLQATENGGIPKGLEF